MFSSLMDRYCLIDEMEEDPVLDSMVSAGFEPDVLVCGTLVNGYCKIGRIDNGSSMHVTFI